MMKKKNISKNLHILIEDVHSPANIRVNNILRNIDEFYFAFDINPDDLLYLKPEERVIIW